MSNTFIASNSSNGTAVLLPASVESGNSISHGSLVGIFVTVLVCLYTQPYGSLLFEGQGGSAWRVNPVSCFAECAVIWGILLVSVTQFIVEEQAARPASRRLALPFIFSPTLERLESTTSATLTVVAQISSRILALKSSSKRFYHRFQQHISATSMCILFIRASGCQSTPDPLLLHMLQMRSETSGLIFDERTTEELRMALGPSALTKHERRVDAMAILSILLVCIKLYATSGVQLFAIAMTPPILSFLTIEALLFSCHSTTSEDLEISLTGRMINSYGNHLRRGKKRMLIRWTWLQILFFGLTLALLDHSFSCLKTTHKLMIEWEVFGTRTKIINTSSSTIMFTVWMLIICLQERSASSIRFPIRIMEMYVPPKEVWIEVKFPKPWMNSVKRVTHLFILAGYLGFVVYVTTRSAFLSLLILTNRTSDARYNDSNTTSAKWLDSAGKVLDSIRHVYILFSMVYVDRIIRGRDRKVFAPWLISFTSVYYTALVFAFYLATFNPKATSQPNWIAYLG